MAAGYEFVGAEKTRNCSHLIQEIKKQMGQGHSTMSRARRRTRTHDRTYRGESILQVTEGDRRRGHEAKIQITSSTLNGFGRGLF